MHKIIQEFEKEQIKNIKIPFFSVGDTVVVKIKIKDGDRSRLQSYEGVVIAKKNRMLGSSFTVRKISHGEGVEKVFQTYSPLIDDIKLKRKGKVRRAKLYYLRGLSKRKARIQEKILINKAEPRGFGATEQLIQQSVQEIVGVVKQTGGGGG